MQAATTHLDPGETVLASVQGRWLTGPRRAPALLIATDRRVVIYGSKMIGEMVASVPYSQVAAIAVSRSVLGSVVAINNAGSTIIKIERVKDPNLPEFQRIVRERSGSET